jgi:molybdate transport system substrate-binding protein
VATGRAVGGLVTAVFLFAAASATRASPAEKPAPLLVAAAANVRPALDEIARDFRQKTGIAVIVSYGSSGILVRQILNDAPFDLFLSADRGFVDRLEKAGRVRAADRCDYAVGKLVVVYARGVPEARTMAELARLSPRRVALANPETAPYGRAARQALEKLGLWRAWRGRLVFAEDVRTALRYADSGDCDLAFAALSEARQTRLHPLPVASSLYEPLVQSAAVLAGSRHREEAMQFLEDLVRPRARAVFERFGYGIP